MILAVIVPLSLAAVAGGVLVLRALEEEAVQRMEEDVQLVSRAIRLPLSRGLEADRVEGALDALESAFRIGRVYGAYLYDGEGRLVSAFGAASTGEDPSQISEMAEEADRLGSYGEAGGEEVYSYFVPLTSDGGRPIGLLQVTRRRSDIEEYLNALRLRVGGSLFAGLLVMTGLVMVGHRGAVGRHLDGLLESMTQVERGDREHRADLGGPREIAGLAGALNRMLDSIQRAEDEVRRHQEEQLRLERELRRSEKMAAVGRLGAGVAHELGTPLSVLDGRAQRLLREPELSGEMAKEVRAIRRETKRMEEIVRQLLDFGRGVHAAPRPVPADRLVRSVVDAHEAERRNRGVEIRVSGSQPAPVLEVDPGAMEQALGNVLKNALHAARSRVDIGWFRDEDRREEGFFVADDGPGVDPDLVDRIFEPFFTTKATGEGTGLGLAVVHGIVDDHGGRVELGSGSPQGARFRIVLPLEDRIGTPDRHAHRVGT
ncbi:MAG: ATP-binding protein [Longimicrobiales bacterium]